MSATDRHIDRVRSTVDSGSAAARSWLAASWRRSALAHGLDPAERSHGLLRVESGSLSTAREAAGVLLALAGPRLDQLQDMIGGSGCGVVLSDASGLLLDRRCATGDTTTFDEWGLCPGTDWSEGTQGTNGIGTCLAEGRHVTVHRDEHFLARNIAMSCIDAPVHGPDGRLVAALDVSSARSEQTAAFNRLIAAAVAQTAARIEAELFRAAHPGTRVIVLDPAATSPALLAVDRDDLVMGATRAARRALDLPLAGGFAPCPAADLMARGEAAPVQPGGLEGAERAAMRRALARSGGNVSEAARALGIGRATFYRRMSRLGLTSDS